MGGSAKRKVGCREELKPALKAREEFLKEHPDLQPLQDEIDRVLGEVVRPEDRMMALALLIEKKLRDLYDSTVDLYFSQMEFCKVTAPNADVTLDDFRGPSGYLN